MKFYVEAALAVMLGAAVWAATHFLFDAGKTACVATQATAQVKEDQQGQADWLKGYDLDFAADTGFAKNWNALNFKATSLEGADHALKPRMLPPAAATLVPNPFPHGFGVCWLAAGTGDEHQAAACQAYAGHGPAGAAVPDPRH